MKILLLGSNGQLGRSIISYFNSFLKLDSIKLIKASRKELDLFNTEICSSFVESVRPDFVINAAAYTEVDKAEKEFYIAKKINSDAPMEIAKALKKTGGKLIQISTDYVFDGNQVRPYLANTQRNPINNYGKSKLAGEKVIEEILFPSNQAIILRTSWILSPIGKNFALTMLDLFKKRDLIRVVSDQIGSPTSALILAKVCWEIILNKNFGESIPKILHWSDAGIASWYDVAVAISEMGNEIGLLNRKPEIIPIFSKDFKTAAKRPYFSVLDSKDTEDHLGIKKLYWRDTLKEILKVRKNYLSGNFII